MIKKLYKYIVLFPISVPCIASDGDFHIFQYRLKKEGISYLVELGVVSAQKETQTFSAQQDNLDTEFLSLTEVSSVSSSATTPDWSCHKRGTKAFALGNLPKPGYIVKNEEQKLLSDVNKIKDEKTASALETLKTIAYDAINQGYQVILKLLLESVRENFFIKIALSEQNIKCGLKKLDQELPGISDYITELLSCVN